MRQAAVLHVVRIIHLDEGAQQVRRTAHHLADFLVRLDIGQRRGAVFIVEEVVLLLDVLDVGMFADHPERVEAFDLGDVQRRILAQPGKGLVRTVPVGIGLRVDNGFGDMGGYGHAFLRCGSDWRPPVKRLFSIYLLYGQQIC